MKTPRISVIVPTHGRPEALRCCLRSLAAQTLEPSAFEVIVVDDGSPIPVTAPMEPPPYALQVCRQEQAGPAEARNRGVARATGEFVAFIDDDCEAAPDWLTVLLTALEGHPGAAAGGTVVNALRHNAYAEASQDLVSFLGEYYNVDPSDARFLTSNNLAFPREALREAGAFNAEYQKAAAEDRELCVRWRATGHRLITVPTAVVRHSHDLNLARFWRQHYTYGRGARQFRAALAARHAEPLRVEPPGFYWRLLTWPIRRRGIRGTKYAALMALTQIANAAGFFGALGGEREAPDIISGPASR
jgi:glycosyltransferase involved in cell wall biosynthesis